MKETAMRTEIVHRFANGGAAGHTFGQRCEWCEMLGTLTYPESVERHAGRRVKAKR